jgi:hypothetical protein
MYTDTIKKNKVSCTSTLRPFETRTLDATSATRFNIRIHSQYHKSGLYISNRGPYL